MRIHVSPTIFFDSVGLGIQQFRSPSAENTVQVFRNPEFNSGVGQNKVSCASPSIMNSLCVSNFCLIVTFVLFYIFFLVHYVSLFCLSPFWSIFKHKVASVVDNESGVCLWYVGFVSPWNLTQSPECLVIILRDCLGAPAKQTCFWRVRLSVYQTIVRVFDLCFWVRDWQSHAAFRFDVTYPADRMKNIEWL